MGAAMTHTCMPDPKPRLNRAKVLFERGVAGTCLCVGVLAIVLLPGGLLLAPCVLALYRKKIELPGIPARS